MQEFQLPSVPFYVFSAELRTVPVPMGVVTFGPHAPGGLLNEQRHRLDLRYSARNRMRKETIYANSLNDLLYELVTSLGLCMADAAQLIESCIATTN